MKKNVPRLCQITVAIALLLAHATARASPAATKDRLLINVHGGAFFLGQGSITEAIPIAAKTGS